MAAVLAGARADVDHPVRGADRFLVVLHDDQRVAEVAQPQQGVEQLLVVPLVQADRRLVEHVQHADQAGADLGGEPDPLRLAARQRGGRPVEREVVEPHVEQEAEAGVDLLEDEPGDRHVPLGQVEVEQVLGQLADRLGAQAAIDLPSIVTARVTGLRRAPLQDGQGTSRMKPANFSRLESDSASAWRRSTYVIAPSKFV